MIELYWLTRLAFLHDTLMVILAVLFMITALLSLTFVFLTPKEKKESPKLKKYIKLSVLTSTIVTLLLLFIPSKNDLYVICGVGTIYDTLKENPTSKEIPNHALKALNSYLKDNITENKSNNNNNNKSK